VTFVEPAVCWRQGKVRPGSHGPMFHCTHDLEAIEADLRFVSRAWRVAREMGCTPRRTSTKY
jgi:hypothetical protein